MMTKSANSLKGTVNYSGDPVSIEGMNEAIASSGTMSNIPCVMCGGSGGWLGFNGYAVCKICNPSGAETVKPTNQA